VAIRKIAVQAVEINGLSQDLFTEINQFEIETSSSESELAFNNGEVDDLLDQEAASDVKKKDLVLI
jgi:hypothetical protein